MILADLRNLSGISSGVGSPARAGGGGGGWERLGERPSVKRKRASVHRVASPPEASFVPTLVGRAQEHILTTNTQEHILTCGARATTSCCFRAPAQRQSAIERALIA